MTIDRPAGSPAPRVAGDPETLTPAPPRRWLRGLAASLVLLAIPIAVDLGRAPSRQLSGRLLRGLIGVYQENVPRLRPFRGHCRMKPSCSAYARQVILDHGTLRGTWLTIRRLLRCGPWTPLGTVDLPPPARSRVESQESRVKSQGRR